MNKYADRNSGIISKFLSLKGFALLLLAVLTLSISASLAWNIMEQRNDVFESAHIYAKTALDKDILYRRWNTLLGGVYAPASIDTPPNPYLEGVVSERDIMTPSGRELTLINPAYMTRQVHELGEKDKGVLGHITSLNPIRKENAADNWEKEALLAFEKGAEEVSSIERINGREYMRLMRPLITEEECLKCHERQGYKKGDIRGGISVAVPMEPLRAVSAGNLKALILGHIILWLCGVGAIYAGYRLRSKVEADRIRAEDRLRNAAEEWRATFDSITDLVSVHDAEFRILKCNKAFADFFKKRPEELIGRHCYDVVHGLESPFHVCPHVEMFKSGKTETSEIFHPGSGLSLMVTASPIFKGGELKGSVHYVKDVTESKKFGTLLNDIAERTSVKTGLEYFNSATKFIADELGFEYAIIGELDSSNDRVKTLSVYAMGDIRDNIEYDLLGTPCKNVMGMRLCFYPEKIQALFPEDKLLVEMKAESYMGMPLFDSDGKALGILVVIGCSPMDEKIIGKTKALLNIFSHRASAEMERIQSEKALSREYRFKSAVLQWASEGLCVCHEIPEFPFVRFTVWNKMMNNITGYTMDEINRSGWYQTVYPDPEVQSRAVERMQRMRLGDDMHNEEWEITRSDGTKCIISISTSVIVMNDNENHVLALMTDVTERKQAVAELEQLNIELEIKNRELEQILYAASHDLKTPLVNINGYSRELKNIIDDIAKVAERGEMPFEIREEILPFIKELPESFKYINMSVLRMDRLLNGLLRFSRSGKLELNKEEIDMNILIKEISDSCEYRFKDTEAVFEAAELPKCTGDRDQIGRIFSNLIENAAKYLDPSRKGVIKVTGHKEDNRVVYCVEDNGIGIAVDHQKQVFHLFHQLDPSKSGDGLGLAIVEGMVERHGGKIWLESDAGKGCRFFVALPA